MPMPTRTRTSVRDVEKKLQMDAVARVAPGMNVWTDSRGSATRTIRPCLLCSANGEIFRTLRTDMTDAVDQIPILQ
jgi:hypothetical protein